MFSFRRYKLVILTKNKKYEFIVSNMRAYEWDYMLGEKLGAGQSFEEFLDWRNLRKITDAMISPEFFMQFYDILDLEIDYIKEYYNALPNILYACQFNGIKENPDKENMPKPVLMYVEGKQNNQGDFTKFPFIDDNWNYDYVIKQMEFEKRLDDK